MGFGILFLTGFFMALITLLLPRPNMKRRYLQTTLSSERLLFSLKENSRRRGDT